MTGVVAPCGWVGVAEGFGGLGGCCVGGSTGDGREGGTLDV